MQETINLLHSTIDNERSELLMADRLKDDLLNQVLNLQSSINLRKEKVDKLEIELKNLYDNQRTERSGGLDPSHIDTYKDNISSAIKSSHTNSANCSAKQVRF